MDTHIDAMEFFSRHRFGTLEYSRRHLIPGLQIGPALQETDYMAFPLSPTSQFKPGPCEWITAISTRFLYILSRFPSLKYRLRHSLSASSPMSGPVWVAAEAAIRTLRSIGYTDACFVGGVACYLYGNTRTPHVCPRHLYTSFDHFLHQKRVLISSLWFSTGP
jgi:hypothetical protein